jgi:diguanylate cyclase (GGDEF)-like protein
MLRRRKELADSIIARLDLANTIRAPLSVADTVYNAHQMGGTNEDGSPTMHQERTAPPNDHERNQLLGAADFWGIANADKIPSAGLKSIIEQRRVSAQNDNQDRSLGDKVQETAVETLGAIGLGGAGELIGLAQRLPFIGDAFAKTKAAKNSERWVSKMNENVIAGLPTEEVSGYKVASKLGGMLGYAIPATGAWKLAGLAGEIPVIARLGSAIASPIARAGIQGAASTALLETGGDQSNEEKAFKVAMGGTIAMAGQALIQSMPVAFEKVRSFFRSKTDPFYADAAPPPGTVDADWWFEADHQIGAPPRQIGPTGNAGGGPRTPPPPGFGSPGNPPGTGWTGGPAGSNDFAYSGQVVPPPGELPIYPPRLNEPPLEGQFEPMAPQLPGPGPEYPIDQSVRMGGQPPQQSMMPQQAPPMAQLMSPERASMQARLDQVVEQRDVARRLLETDVLTGGGNKTALERVKATIDADPTMGWVAFDGKQFKAVNDNFGHDAGDQALANFGRAIQQAAQELNVPARFFRQGGDEFAAIVPQEHMETFARRATELSKQTLVKPDGSMTVNTSLDAYHAPTFDEADLSLMQNKRGAKIADRDAALQSEMDRILGQHESWRATSEDYASIPPEEKSLIMQEFQPSQYSDAELVALHERNSMQAVNLSDMAAERGFAGMDQAADVASFRASLIESELRNRQGPVKFTPDTAAIEGATLSKQTSLMEGDLEGIAGSSSIDDSNVALHAVVKNEGRISVIQGVGDVGKTVRQLVQSQQEGKLMPHHFRVVDRNGKMDLLISDGLPITNKRVGQYKATGMFEGQNVIVNGKPMVVTQPSGPGGLVTVKEPGGPELGYSVPAESVLPGNSSEHGVVEGGEKLYQRFKAYVQDQMAAGAQRLGGKVDTEWTSTETSSQLPHMLETWLDDNVGQAARGRSAIEGYFNTRRVQDFQDLAPKELADLQTANAELASEVRSAPAIIPPMEDIAATKGFSFVNDPEAESGQLVDRLSDLRVPVESPEAAIEFLRSFNRELPDYTPISDVPIEVMGANPHAANPGDDLEPVWSGGHEQQASFLVDRLGQITAQLHEFGIELPPVEDVVPDLYAPQPPPVPPEGGAGAPPPPPPREPFLGGGGQNALPPGQRSLGAAFAQAQRQRPRELSAITRSLDSAWLNYAMPFRSVTISLQNQLQNIGIEEAKLWNGYSDIVTGVTQAHNEAHPWHAEAADIFSYFRRRLLRNGTVTRVQEIADYNQKIAAMRRAGYTPSEMAAQKRLGDFNDRFFNYLVNDGNFSLDHSRYVNGYMSRVRMRQGMPGISDPFADKDGMLPREFQFFAEMAREGNMQFRQMDARTLTTTMIRAAMFKKNVAPSFDQMVQAWDDPRIPTDLRNLVTDWLKVVKTGHNPQYDVAVQGARHFANKMGVPITNGEAAALWNSTFSNMYRGALGGRPDAVFRDSIQPWLAGTRIGMTPIADSYRRFLGGQAGDMFKRGVEGGWIERGQVRVPNADVFEHGVYDTEGTSLMSDRDQNRREIMARVGDLAWQMTPRRLRGGIQGTGFDPLFFYQKLGELNRLISGDAGWTVASKAIGNYQYKMGQLYRGEVAMENGQMLVDKMDEFMSDLMKDSKARVYPKPIRDQFQALVAKSDFEGAANLLANEAANSQFRYGQKENPIGIRKAGMTGRMGMMFGSFTQQYISFMQEQFASDIPAVEKVAMGLRHGLVLATLGSASAYTGWNFGKWMWHQALGFAGGPLATGLYNAAQAGTGALTSAFGGSPTPGQSRAMESFANATVGGMAASAANSVNPLASTYRTGENYYDAARSMNPGESVARVTITGERGLGPDFRQYFSRQEAVIPEDVEAAVNGQSAALAKFSPDEQAFMQQLQHMPRNRRYQAFMSYRNAGTRAADSAEITNRGGFVPGGMAPPGMPAPGAPIAPFNPADSSTPGLTRYNRNGFPVYNSTNIDPNGQVPTHRLDIPSGKGPNETWEQYENRVKARDRSSFPSTVHNVNADPAMLVPEMRDSLVNMISAAAQQGVHLRIAETYRPQERQEYLFQQGRSTPGSPVTWTLTSDHATHTGADLEPVGNSQAGYSWIQQNAGHFGFSTLGANDPGHVAFPGPGAGGRQ